MSVMKSDALALCANEVQLGVLALSGSEVQSDVLTISVSVRYSKMS